MIEIIISDDCPHCEQQLDVMQKSFFADEYRIIRVGSDEFDRLPDRVAVNAVPFVLVRDDDGAVKYAGKGVHDGTELRKIDRRTSSEPFNLRRVRAAMMG
jgi:hypothetical protein